MDPETLPVPRDLLEEIADVLLAEGIKEVRDPKRSKRLHRLWKAVVELLYADAESASENPE